MRKASIFFLIFGVILGFIWGTNSLSEVFGDLKGDEDDDEPEPSVSASGACKPNLHLV